MTTSQRHRGTLLQHYLRSAGALPPWLRSVIALFHPFAGALSKSEALALLWTFLEAL
jgi:hypothetical protein